MKSKIMSLLPFMKYWELETISRTLCEALPITVSSGQKFCCLSELVFHTTFTWKLDQQTMPVTWGQHRRLQKPSITRTGQICKNKLSILQQFQTKNLRNLCLISPCANYYSLLDKYFYLKLDSHSYMVCLLPHSNKKCSYSSRILTDFWKFDFRPVKSLPL